MIQPIHFYLLGAFIVAMVIANIVLPNILLISHKKKLFDMPDKRKVHHAPIPRLGGLSFFPVMLITMGGLVLIYHLMGLSSGSLHGEVPYAVPGGTRRRPDWSGVQEEVPGADIGGKPARGFGRMDQVARRTLRNLSAVAMGGHAFHRAHRGVRNQCHQPD